MVDGHDGNFSYIPVLGEDCVDDFRDLAQRVAVACNSGIAAFYQRMLKVYTDRQGDSYHGGANVQNVLIIGEDSHKVQSYAYLISDIYDRLNIIPGSELAVVDYDNILSPYFTVIEDRVNAFIEDNPHKTIFFPDIEKFLLDTESQEVLREKKSPVKTLSTLTTAYFRRYRSGGIRADEYFYAVSPKLQTMAHQQFSGWPKNAFVIGGNNLAVCALLDHNEALTNFFMQRMDIIHI